MSSSMSESSWRKFRKLARAYYATNFSDDSIRTELDKFPQELITQRTIARAISGCTRTDENLYPTMRSMRNHRSKGPEYYRNKKSE